MKSLIHLISFQILITISTTISYSQTWDNTNAEIAKLFFNVSGNDPWIWYDNATGFKLTTKYGYDFQFFDGSNHNLTIKGDGKIGIGESSPQQLLHVKGNAVFKVSGGDDLFFKPDGNNRRGIISSNFQLAFIADKVNSLSSDKKIIFGAGDTTPDGANFVQYLIVDNGRVGIGNNVSTFNGHKLVVDGSINSKEVKVTSSVPGPDYVFEPDYDLMPLYELGKYLRKNKHLPEIPSAKQIEANGIMLGEMNMLLLKKIEELTLYQLELLERIESLEKRLTQKGN